MKITWRKISSIILVLVVFGVALVLVPSRVFAATEEPVVPVACTAVRSLDGSSIDVTWQPAKNDNAAHYVVYRKRNGGKWHWAGRSEAPATMFTDNTLRSQDLYEISVATRRSDDKKSERQACSVSSQAVPNVDPKLNAPGGPEVEVPAAGNAAPAVASSGPVPVPKCAYWGAYVNSRLHGGGNDAAAKLRAINSVENQIGRQFDIDHQFYQWDNFVNKHNVDNYVRPTIDQGRIPFLSWKPIYQNRDNVSWASIANGKHDALIKEKAATVKSLKVPVFITVDHEADSRVGTFEPGNVGPGHVKANAGSAAEYVAAWRHIHDLFAQEGVTNVSWTWLMTRAPFSGDGSFADRLYPGDGYVDWIGPEPYNFFHGQKQWNSLETQMAGFTKWVDSRGIDKPWMLGEWGTVEDPKQSGRKAAWYQEAADYMESEPRLKAPIYFESKPVSDWRIGTTGSSLESFSQVGKRGHFNGSC